MIENKFGCPNKIWVTFTNKQRQTFNYFRKFTLDDIIPIPHSISNSDWDVISFNYALHAAWNLPTKKAELTLWTYLKKKLVMMNDNNKTAKQVFNKITR